MTDVVHKQKQSQMALSHAQLTPVASTGVDGHLHKKEDIEVDGAPLVLGFGEAFSHSRQQGADRKVDK